MGLAWEKIEEMLDSEGVLITSSSNPEIELHGHNFFEFVYVLEGRAMQIKNQISSVIKQGDYFIVDYGVTHMYHRVNGEKFKIINCMFRPKLIDETLENSSRFKDLVNNYLIRFSYKNIRQDPTDVVFQDTDKNTILGVLNKIVAEYEAKEVGYQEIIRSYLIVIIISMMRAVTPPDIITDDNSTQYIIDYIKANYMRPIKLSDFCSVLNYSLPYLSKKFKIDTGMSFIDYLQQIRIEQSCRLLANTDKKIEEIAMLVGYGNTPFFNNVFKKNLNMSPRMFRKLRKGK